MMVYVVILLAVGAACILKLWTAQRKATARRYSIDAHDSLKRLSSRPAPGTVAAGRVHESRGPGRTNDYLSPENRAAAKRRIEARRARGRLGDRGRKTRARAG